MKFSLSFVLSFCICILLSFCNEKEGTKPGSQSSILYYNEDGTETIKKVKNLNDGGFLYVGQASNKAFAMKVGSGGERKWYKTFGGGRNAQFFDVAEQTNGEIILVGYTNSAENSIDISAGLIVKLSKDGKEVWQRTYVGVYPQRIRTVALANDGTIAVGGGVETSDDDTWLMKLSSEGEIIWSRVYDALSSWHDGATSMLVAPEGHYVFAGYASPNSQATSNRKFVVNLHGVDQNNGTILWGGTFYQYPNRFAGGSFASPRVIRVDDGYVWATTQYDIDTVRNIQLVKTTLDGKNVFGKKYYGLGAADLFNVQKTADGGFLINGSTRSKSSPILTSQAFLLSIDSDGEERWSSYIGGLTSGDKCYQSSSTITGWRHAGKSTDSKGVNSLMFYYTDKTGNLRD